MVGLSSPLVVLLFKDREKSGPCFLGGNVGPDMVFPLCQGYVDPMGAVNNGIVFIYDDRWGFSIQSTVPGPKSPSSQYGFLQ